MRPVHQADKNDSGPKPDREIKPGNPPEDKTGCGSAEIKSLRNDLLAQLG